MRRRVGIALLLVALLGTVAYSAWRWRFPHGWSHCCMVSMMHMLHTYADEHDGRFPTGGQSPEASLSIMYEEGYLDGYALSGMVASPRRTMEGPTSWGV